MFFERLAEARQQVELEEEEAAQKNNKGIVAPSSPSSSSSPKGSHSCCKTKEEASSLDAAQGEEDSEEGGKNESIISKVSEFLFDVFDANEMPEYKLIADFERSASAAFDTDSEEYTLEQKRLHEDFSKLMEDILGGFLAKEGWTVEGFYEEVKACRERNEAEDVTEVLSLVTDFKEWAREQKRQAEQRRKYCLQGGVGR